MCKVKSCARPSFVGGLCGYHALEHWSAGKRDVVPHALLPQPSAHPLRRRRAVQRPVSG